MKTPLIRFVSILLFTALLLPPFTQPIYATQPFKIWEATALAIKDSESYCLDTGQPNRMLVYQYDAATTTLKETYLADLKTGQRTFLNSHAFSQCAPNGIVYADPQDRNDPGVFRYSTLEAGESKLAYKPSFLALDGSRYLYNFTPVFNNESQKSKILVSQDGGLNWQEIGQQFNGMVRSFVIANSDARSAYALVQNPLTGSDGMRNIAIYLTQDAGASWSKRFEGTALYDYSRAGIAVYLSNLSENPQTPVNVIGLIYEGGGFGSSNVRELKVSVNGAASFTSLGFNRMSSAVTAYYSNGKLLRVSKGYPYSPANTKLDYSSDGGANWQNLSLPDELTSGNDFGTFLQFYQSPVVSSNIYVSRKEGVWMSPDLGQTWQKITGNPPGLGLMFSPYAPSRIYTLGEDRRFYSLDVSEYDKSLTAVEPDNDLSGGNFFFPQTGHNLNGIFKQYWRDKGGLMQFGYPRTEPFYEVNPADGKIYLAQYFERNRFEYHPELSGTPYEVMLGLLGNQITEPLRQAGHGAFNRFENMRYPGATWFPETGHNLRNSFKAYWESHGGLFIYGYPISEEYYELNPDDGKNYVVQYFERARLEWHPELSGTPFGVLMGLLGNALLRNKGWL
ncbi:hypothetical protein [Candidatus Chlorohelix sp.]|uniref:hypothetical protein n=1 Tax=Candidatus Chlorohelix sp. TaxID=3139201 RepID=UPI003071A37B